jgi:hypothetical protein
LLLLLCHVALVAFRVSMTDHELYSVESLSVLQSNLHIRICLRRNLIVIIEALRVKPLCRERAIQRDQVSLKNQNPL